MYSAEDVCAILEGSSVSLCWTVNDAALLKLILSLCTARLVKIYFYRMHRSCNYELYITI